MGDTLNLEVCYPLYEPDEQVKRFERGEETHKLPGDMNRKERRRVGARERKRKAKVKPA